MSADERTLGERVEAFQQSMERLGSGGLMACQLLREQQVEIQRTQQQREHVRRELRNELEAAKAEMDSLRRDIEATSKEAALARAIERAAGELPERHMISVHVERGAGWVEATVTSEGGPDMTLAEQVNALVDAACAAGSAR